MYITLYEYEILAFDRQVAGSSPTVGVWSPYQRKGVLQRMSKRGLIYLIEGNIQASESTKDCGQFHVFSYSFESLQMPLFSHFLKI